MNNSYAKAYTEVLELLSYIPEEELKKIPSDKIEFYKENMDKDYVFSIDPEKDISEQNISQKTNDIIIYIFQEYFATQQQKEVIENILNTNQQNEENLKRKIYNPDDIFKQNETTQKEDIKQDEVENFESLKNTNENSLIKTKESFFIRIKNFILKILHIKE